MEGIMKHCPHCGFPTTMVEVKCWFDGNDEVRYRCMNCLWLFTQEMTPVV